MVKAKRFSLVRHFEGLPTKDNFKLEDQELPELKDDGKKRNEIINSMIICFSVKGNIFSTEILVEALYFSVDPYMRPYVAMLLKPGDAIIGGQVGK